MTEHLVVSLTGDEQERLKEIATVRGFSSAELLRRLALDEIDHSPRRRANNRGRTDTIAVKVARLHALGMNDIKIADALGCSANTVAAKRADLSLPAAPRFGRPKKEHR